MIMKNICSHTHSLSLSLPHTHSGVRPFGVSLLIAGYDEDIPFLFQCDPSVSSSPTLPPSHPLSLSLSPSPLS